MANDDLFTAARQLKVINNQKRLQTGKLVAIGPNAKALLQLGFVFVFSPCPPQLFPFFGCGYYQATLIVNNNYYFISGKRNSHQLTPTESQQSQKQ